jgi:hypothetical protein
VNRWARIVLTLAALATAGWIAAGVAGYTVASDDTLARHTLLAFSALLALLLTHAWVAVFAAASARALRGRHSEASGAALVELVKAARLAAGGASVAIAAAVLQFTLSSALYPGRWPPRAHALAGLFATVLLVAALLIEARALRRHERAARALAEATDPRC